MPCREASARLPRAAVLRHLALNERRREAYWQRFFVVPADELCLARAVEIGCAHGVRTLDAIHLAAAERIREAATFVTFDERQRKAAETLAPVVA